MTARVWELPEPPTLEQAVETGLFMWRSYEIEVEIIAPTITRATVREYMSNGQIDETEIQSTNAERVWRFVLEHVGDEDDREWRDRIEREIADLDWEIDELRSRRDRLERTLLEGKPT